MALIFDFVDNNIVLQITSSKMIELSGWDIFTNTLYNGKQTIVHLVNVKESELPDVVLLDINMPILNRCEYLDSLKVIKSNLSKKISVFIVSSSMDERDILKSKEYKEVIHYLVKPLEQKSLEHILSSIGHM